MKTAPAGIPMITGHGRLLAEEGATGALGGLGSGHQICTVENERKRWKGLIKTRQGGFKTDVKLRLAFV